MTETGTYCKKLCPNCSYSSSPLPLVLSLSSFTTTLSRSRSLSRYLSLALALALALARSLALSLSLSLSLSLARARSLSLSLARSRYLSLAISLSPLSSAQPTGTAVCLHLLSSPNLSLLSPSLPYNRAHSLFFSFPHTHATVPLLSIYLMLLSPVPFISALRSSCPCPRLASPWALAFSIPALPHLCV